MPGNNYPDDQTNPQLDQQQLQSSLADHYDQANQYNYAAKHPTDSRANLQK